MEGQAMPAHGAFCWNELATNDAAGAKKFYTELLGWEWKEGDAPGVTYNEIVVDGRPAGGVFQMCEEFGDAPPHWTVYVAVKDVDESARKVWELGGEVRMPPTDIPNVGRFCVVMDPAGATLSLITLGRALS